MTSDLKFIQRLHDFFKGIPGKKWCVGELANDKRKCCALGHLGVRSIFKLNPRAYRAQLLFSEHLGHEIGTVNNGGVSIEGIKFKNRAPKGNTLAAIKILIGKLKKAK